MNSAWSLARLEELTPDDSPITYGVVKPGEPGDVLFIRGGDLAGGRILSAQLRTITSIVSEQYRRTLLRGGELLICLVGQPGQVAVAPSSLAGANIARQVGLIRLLPSVDADFISYFLQSPDGQAHLGRYTGGSVQQVINLHDLRTVKVPVPPLPEQQRIVSLLDEAFEGIATAKANAEKNLQNARALFENHLQSVFAVGGPDWNETTLEFCCEQIFAGGDVPKDRLSRERTAKFSVPIFSNGERNNGLYGFTDVPRVTKPSITVSARGTLGFTAIRSEPYLPVVRLIVLVPDKERIELSFLYYAIQGMDFGNTGTSIPQLTVPNFKETKLRIPRISDQNAIVLMLDDLMAETQRLTQIYQQKIAALDELKKALLHKAFSGEL